jgi:hypothetical protein
LYGLFDLFAAIQPLVGWKFFVIPDVYDGFLHPKPTFHLSSKIFYIKNQTSANKKSVISAFSRPKVQNAWEIRRLTSANFHRSTCPRRFFSRRNYDNIITKISSAEEKKPLKIRHAADLHFRIANPDQSKTVFCCSILPIKSTSGPLLASTLIFARFKIFCLFFSVIFRFS